MALDIESELIDKLRCGLVRTRLCPEYFFCEFFFPEGHCCDMTGAINLAKYYMEGTVKIIYTYSGEVMDTVYLDVSVNDEEPESWIANCRNNYEDS